MSGLTAQGSSWVVAANLFDEPLGVLAADEHLKPDAEREFRREGVVDDGVDEQPAARASDRRPKRD